MGFDLVASIPSYHHVPDTYNIQTDSPCLPSSFGVATRPLLFVSTVPLSFFHTSNIHCTACHYHLRVHRRRCESVCVCHCLGHPIFLIFSEQLRSGLNIISIIAIEKHISKKTRPLVSPERVSFLCEPGVTSASSSSSPEKRCLNAVGILPKANVVLQKLVHSAVECGVESHDRGVARQERVHELWCVPWKWECIERLHMPHVRAHGSHLPTRTPTSRCSLFDATAGPYRRAPPFHLQRACRKFFAKELVSVTRSCSTPTTTTANCCCC